MKKLLLILIVASMSSCTFEAMEAKESTEKLKKDIDQRTKEKLSQWKD